MWLWPDNRFHHRSDPFLCEAWHLDGPWASSCDGPLCVVVLSSVISLFILYKDICFFMCPKYLWNVFLWIWEAYEIGVYFLYEKFGSCSLLIKIKMYDYNAIFMSWRKSQFLHVTFADSGVRVTLTQAAIQGSGNPRQLFRPVTFSPNSVLHLTTVITGFCVRCNTFNQKTRDSVIGDFQLQKNEMERKMLPLSFFPFSSMLCGRQSALVFQNRIIQR